MEDLKVFENPKFGTVRTIEENGTVLFCGKDVAKALGYKDATNAMKQHCKGVVKRHLLSDGGEQETNFLPEGDVYRLIVKSQLPEAEAFERWLFEEVLPSIRKSGGYISGQEELSPAELMAKALMVAQKTLADREARISALTVENQRMLPKAEYFDELVDRNLLTSIRDTAKLLERKERVFVNYLITNRFLYRDKKGQLMPMAGKGDGLFEIKESKNEKTGWVGTQTLVTPRGRETFRLLCEGI